MTATSSETPARPDPARHDGPHIHSGQTDRQMVAAWLLAALVISAVGAVLFGPAVLTIVAVAVATAVGADLLMRSSIEARSGLGSRYAALTGVMLALTLPPTAPWYVPFVGALAAVVPAIWMFGGLGHHLWQPALVGRVLVQFLFAPDLSFNHALASGPILVPGRMLMGDIHNAQPMAIGSYQGWSRINPDFDIDAVSVARPIQILRQMAAGQLPVGRSAPLTVAIRDYLPPWPDTVVGTTSGDIGATCSIALIVVGLYLIYRGFLRWQIPVFGLLGAAITAAVLPLTVPESPGLAATTRWFPATWIEGGQPVGLLYVLFHLTGGQLLLCLMLPAGDALSRPLLSRGQAIFATAIGALSVLIALYGIGECAGYWAVLIGNTFVPIIDRWTRRRPLGLP